MPAIPTGRSKGYTALFGTIALWSVPSLFQYYLIRFYDPWSQNFYRYLVAFVAIVPFVFYHFRRNGRPLSSGAFIACLWPSLPNVVHQISQVVALFYVGPGVYSVFIRSSVIFTALLALILFPEERHVIKQWQFLVGTFLGLVGAFGVIWFQPNGTAEHVAWPGLLIAFAATFCWALYSVLVKRPSARFGTIRTFGLISFITSALLFPLTLAFGNIATPVQVGTEVNVILIVSAVSCITLAHVLYYVAIHQIGVALAQTLQLLCPLGAVALSAWIFHEQLSRAQLWSSAILLIGAFLAMRTKPVATAEAAEAI